MSDIDVGDMMAFKHGKKSAAARFVQTKQKTSGRRKGSFMMPNTHKKSLRRNYDTRSRSRSRDHQQDRMMRHTRRDQMAGKRSVNYKETSRGHRGSRSGLKPARRRRLNSQESAANERRVFHW